MVLPDGYIYIENVLFMFYIYINKKKKRILITTNRNLDRDWKLIAFYPERELAMARGRRLADISDYVLEWVATSRY